MGNKIISKEMPICVNCVHAYVCEEYNLNRDMLRKRCAYHNDHFLDMEQYKKQTIKETAEKFVKELRNFIYLCDDLELDTGTYEKISNKMDELAKQFDVEIKE